MSEFSKLRALWEQEAAAAKVAFVAAGGHPQAHTDADVRLFILNTVDQIEAAKKADRLKTGRTP